jgi:hypothetical protein
MLGISLDPRQVPGAAIDENARLVDAAYSIGLRTKHETWRAHTEMFRKFVLPCINGATVIRPGTDVQMRIIHAYFQRDMCEPGYDSDVMISSEMPARELAALGMTASLASPAKSFEAAKRIKMFSWLKTNIPLRTCSLSPKLGGTGSPWALQATLFASMSKGT